MTKVALITGGGTGIGASAATLLAKAGWTVVVCGRREEVLQRVASACGAIPMTVDLTVPAENARLISDIVADHGRLDGLVLNAGLQHLGTFESLTEEQWNAIVATNLTSPFLMVKAALPALLKTAGGSRRLSHPSPPSARRPTWQPTHRARPGFSCWPNSWPWTTDHAASGPTSFAQAGPVRS